MGPLDRFQRLGRVGSWGLGAILAGSIWSQPSAASASVPGKQGLEIEGAQDRRGFYFGVGPGFGFTNFSDTWVPNTRIEVSLGGGISRRLTLGFTAHVSPYLRPDTGVAFGGDAELNGFVFRGLFLRAGLGGGGLPKTADGGGIVGTVGGLAGLGYEFFLNASAALGFSVNYDLRFVPGADPRQGGFAGVRFSWY